MVTAASRTLYAEYGSWPTLLYLLRIPRAWGTANELKMKYFADNEFRHLQGEELNKAIREKIRQKDEKNQPGRKHAGGRHNAAQTHRPSGQPERPDQRKRRQGNPGCPY